MQTLRSPPMRRTPTRTLLSNRMRNAMALGVGQNGLYAILRHLELLRNFGHAYTIIVVIYNRADRHPGTAQHGSAAVDARVDLDQRALRPVDPFLRSHGDTSKHYDFIFSPKTPDGSGLHTCRAVSYDEHRTYPLPMNTDERIEAIVMSLELLTRDTHDLRAAVQTDAENIRALARIAEIHEHRLTELEDPNTQ